MTGLELLLGCLSTKSVIEAAVAGFIGNRADMGGVACGRYLYERLARDPHNPENHDVARAVQTAYVRAMHWFGDQCLRRFRAGTADWTERLAADAVSKAVKTLDARRPLPAWVPDAAGLRADAEALFGGPGGPAGHVAQRSFAALEAATGPLPDSIRTLFFAGDGETRSWPASFELLFAEQVKTNPRVQAITSYAALQELKAQGFDMAARLTALTSLATDGMAELQQIHGQLDQLGTAMASGFADTQAGIAQIIAMMQAQAPGVSIDLLRDLARQAGAANPGADPDQLAAFITTKLARLASLDSKYAAREAAEDAASARLEAARSATARADYAAADAALQDAEAIEAAEFARIERASRIRRAETRALRAETADLAGDHATAIQLFDEAVALLPDDATAERRRHAGDAAFACEALAVRLASPAYLRAALDRWQALDDPALRQTDPAEWSKLRNNIGGLQSQLAVHEDDPALLAQAVDNLLQAIDGFALQVEPEHRAMALANLGRTLERMAEQASEPLPAQAAVSCHRNAVNILAALHLSTKAAACQIGLADALVLLARLSRDPAPCREATELLRALTADSTGLLAREEQLQAWISLAQAQLQLARLDGDLRALGRALKAATVATERADDRARAGLATDAWMILGQVHDEMARHQSDRHALGAAITAYETALQLRGERPRDRVWADFQTRLALAVSGHTILEPEVAQLERAAALLDDVARFWQLAGGGTPLSASLRRLADVQGDLGMARGDELLLAQSVSTWRAALALLVHDTHPHDWRSARAGLCEALILLAGFSADNEAAREGFGMLDVLVLETAASGPPDLHARLTELRGKSQQLRAMFGL